METKIEQKKFLKVIFRRKKDGIKVIAEGSIKKENQKILIVEATSKITFNQDDSEYQKVDLGNKIVKIFPSEIEGRFSLTKVANPKINCFDDCEY